MFKRVCVFCGSHSGANAAYREAATAMGSYLAERQIELVYGGGGIGLMGTLADAVLSSGGVVTGVIPEFLSAKEIAHPKLNQMYVVQSMHERKAKMAELADAFIAMPGGIGTFEEFFEVVTWAQLGLHQKPCGLLNTRGYYDPLLALLDRALEEGFLKLEHRSLFVTSDSPKVLLDLLERARGATFGSERKFNSERT